MSQNMIATSMMTNRQTADMVAGGPMTSAQIRKHSVATVDQCEPLTAPTYFRKEHDIRKQEFRSKLAGNLPPAPNCSVAGIDYITGEVIKTE